MADGRIEIDTQIDTKGVEKGVKNVSSELGKLSKLVKGAGFTAVIGATTKTLKEMTKGIKETSDAYNVQLKAEKLLETSAKTNPLLNGESVAELKSFASTLQSISTYGDESLLPLMSNLASSGRSQAEIMDIMSASVDLASTGVVSLEQAVQSLNLSYSGSTGQLARYVPKLKDLTAEQLKNGEAVKFVKEQYKGMAEETTKATGSYQQMKNAQGDFNEAVGRMTKPTADLWNNFWKGWYEKGIEAITKINNAIDTKSARNNLEALAWESDDDYRKLQTLVKKNIANSSTEELEGIVAYYSSQGDKLESYQKLIKTTLETEIQSRKQTAEALEEERKKQEALNKTKKEEAEASKKVADYKQENQDALDKELEQIEIEKKLREDMGETVDENAYHQERLNAMTSSYVSLIADSNGEVTANNSLAKERLEQIKEEASLIQEDGEALEDYTDKYKVLESVIDEYNKESQTGSIEALKKLKEQLIALQPTLDGDAEKLEKVANAIKGIDDAIENMIANNIADVFGTIGSGLGDISSAFNDLSDSLTSSWENEQATELDALNEQYEDGLISYEEYIKGKEELDKQYAEYNYKLQLAEWSLKLAEATSSIAQGVASALSGTPPASFINASAVAVMGAGQLATIIASKPKKNFATGGIVGGSSYYGDNVQANVNSGEMILNAQQQLELWKMANGSKGGGTSVNIPVNIENYTDASVSTDVSAEQIKVIINNTVQSGLVNGTYDSSLAIQQGSLSGKKLL